MQLLAEYFDTGSSKFIFRENKYECKKRKQRSDTVPFDQTVGGKKQAFLDNFFDKDDKLTVDWSTKDLKFMR